MQERKQKTQIGASTQKDRTEYEGYVSGPTFGGTTKNNLTGDHQSGYGMLEEILSPSNLNAAYQEVVRNNGAGRIDGMEVESLKDYLIAHRKALLTILYRGNDPSLVYRIKVLKEDGSKRQLGISLCWIGLFNKPLFKFLLNFTSHYYLIKIMN